MVFSRVGELEYEYLQTVVWALGIAVSGYRYNIEPDYKLRLLTMLNQ